MTDKPPVGLNAADYDAIEAAVMETARGRWFLIENGRRRRAAETAQLLEAVTRLERAVGTGSAPALAAPVKAAALPAPAREPLPHATAIGERLQDIAWNMRERGLDDTVCAAVEEQARLLVSPPGRRLPPCRPLRLRPQPHPTRGSRRSRRIDRMPLAEKLALFA